VIVRRSNYRRMGILAALCGVLVVAGTAAAASARQTATKVKVCYANAATDFTPAFVAKNEGFFDRNGLDVDLVLASGGRGAQFLASGACDINLDSATPNITAIQRGSDVVLLGADANTFDFRLVGKSSITGVKGLAGKKLALSSPGAAVDIAGRAMLEQAGLSASDVTIVYISSLSARLAALQSGSIDAMVISPPIGKVIGSNSADKMIFNLKGLHFILSGTFAKRSYVQANPDVVKAYLRSDVQAIAWLKDPANKAGVLKDVGQVTGFTDSADVEEAYDDVLKYQQPEPLIDARSLKNSIEWVEGQLNTQIDQNSFLFLGPLQQVLTRHLTAGLKGAGASKASLTGTVTPAGGFSYSLKIGHLTGNAIAAELHLGRSGSASPAVLRLCGPCKTQSSGAKHVGGKILAALKQGNAFVTVSTPKNAKGEVRGQIVARLG
jgi:NitT/TauT family transport system substrate-binding protein